MVCVCTHKFEAIPGTFIQVQSLVQVQVLVKRGILVSDNRE
jgi:hypothetical protein